MNVSAMDSKRPGSALIGRYLAHKERESANVVGNGSKRSAFPVGL